MRQDARLIGEENTHLLYLRRRQPLAQVMHDGRDAFIGLESMHLRHEIRCIEAGQYGRTAYAITVGSVASSAGSREDDDMLADFSTHAGKRRQQ